MTCNATSPASRVIIASALLAGIVLLGCGSSGGAGSDSGTSSTTSGVSGSKRLDALTNDEKGKLCDFTAAHFGGYGKSIDCGGGNTLDAAASQAECIAAAPTACAATVAQAEQCLTAQSCANPLPPACVPIFQCAFAMSSFTPAN